MGDGWRLSVGTLTALPVRGPATVDRATARSAMLLAPIAVLPLAVVVGVLLWVGGQAGLPVLAVAVLAVGALALGSRALHWDGLSDVADGLTASYDAERSLAVMKSGTAGPAGVVAVVVVAGLQVVVVVQHHALLVVGEAAAAGALLAAAQPEPGDHGRHVEALEEEHQRHGGAEVHGQLQRRHHHGPPHRLPGRAHDGRRRHRRRRPRP